MSFPYQTPIVRRPNDAEWEAEIESLPGISRIAENDIPRLRQLLAANDDVDSYLTSPTYYSFTGRRGLWVYEKDDGFLLMCRHPNVADQILIFPQLGRSDADLISDLLERIPAPDGNIRLARVKTGDTHEQDSLFFDKRSVTLKKCEETVLDWKYPVHILSTIDMAALEGSRYKRLRYTTKVVNDRSPHVTAFDAVSHGRALENLLHRWAAHNASTREEYELLYAPYDTLFSQSMDKSSGLSGLMIFTDNALQAVSLWDISNAERKTANLYVDFCNVQIAGLSEYLMVKSCEALRDKGIGFLNLGGSEGEGLDNFKRKFRPITIVDLCSVNIEIKDNVHPSPQRIVNPSKRHQAVLRPVPNV